jgi:hypothetical protein
MTFVPENELESALIRATKEPAARPDFYRLLLESDLLVLGTIEKRETAAGAAALSPGDNVQLASAQANGRSYIPVFSSMTRLQTYIREEQKYLSMNGLSLFEMAVGATFVLNPGSDYGKELLPAEIANLLNPGAQGPRKVTLDKPTNVLIGQPAVYPHDLVNALKEAFTARPNVLAAHLIQIAFSGRDEPSHPLIGVEVIGDWQPISVEIGRIAGLVAPGVLLDAAPIDRTKTDDTLTAALLKVPPFYSRKLSTT